jgi:diguanylate cyclase (GGDEF)-like protein/PAS domain S-box-containing protein
MVVGRARREDIDMPGVLSKEALAEIVEATHDMVVVFETAGQIVFVNDAVTAILGGDADTYIGTNIVDHVHPDDLERAFATLDVSARVGAVPGAAFFRIRGPDGSYESLELTTGAGLDAGGADLRFVICRKSQTRVALEEILRRLMEGSDLARVMLAVCDVFEWQGLGAGVAIVWREPDGKDRSVTTGLPIELSGAGGASPWREARETRERTVGLDLTALSGPTQAIAAEHGFGGYWIEPIEVTGASALVTLWTAAGEILPTLHSQGMELVRDLLGVILRWVDQQHELDFAATHDTLTGLANRTAFYGQLRRTAGGAVLYCDLDGFKPVNDRFGHAAGDAVLQLVAERLRACLRAGDFVARMGGDEFAVLCPGTDSEGAAALAHRIRSAVGAPIDVNGTTVSVMISVGTALEDTLVREATLHEADRDLYRQKLRLREVGHPIP